VALGGGHGLYASLSALRHVTDRLTGIVTVADNGGSSGRLRAEFDVLPPGDLRQAIAALCGDDDWGSTWARVLQHRFDGTGTLAGLSLGNLLIVALWDLMGPIAGLEWVGRLLGAKGRVLPMAAVPLTIVGDVAGLIPGEPAAVTTIRGQVQVAATAGQVQAVRLDPHDPPAFPEALAAVSDADAVVLGPGSWFTSVMPHLMVPELAAALRDCSARRVLTLNVAAQQGETDGFTPARHLAVLREHAPWLRLDAVVVDDAFAADRTGLDDAAAACGAELVVADPVDTCEPTKPRHDVAKLAAVYEQVLR
jgi:uncharacterized cofD-like protein